MPTRRIALVATAVAAALAAVSPAPAQFDPNADYAVITAAESYVRSGPHHSYYPFAEMTAGDVVVVVGEADGWTKIATMGPAFEDAFGYVKYAKSRTDKLRLEPDGKTALTLGRTDIVAPNISSNRAAESWRTILRLPANREIEVIETTRTERDIIHSVKLPPEASGWVNTMQIRAATQDEIDAYARLLAGEPATPPVDIDDVAADPPQDPTPPNAIPEEDITPVTPPADDVADTVAPADDEANVHSNQPADIDPGEISMPTTDDIDAADDETAPHAAGEPIKDDGPARNTNVEKGGVSDDTARLDALEVKFEAIRKLDVKTAEVGPLKNLYDELAATAEEDRVVRYAQARSEQLQIWLDLQDRRVELDRIRARVNRTGEETAATRMALDAAGDYTVVGRLVASRLYDGQKLPQLFRLQDAATGRTVAYIKPTREFELVTMLDALIGIIGDKHYDGSLRLNLIEPRRIDLLAPQREDREKEVAAAATP